jgi:galactokinase
MIAGLVANAFREHFASTPTIALAPGRVNLIGEHTDYNEGFVFPAAIDRHVALAFGPNDEGLLRGRSLEFGDRCSIRLGDYQEAGWVAYVSAVTRMLQEEGLPLRGMDFVVGGDLPMGAGLSSSAALQLATARALYEVSRVAWNGRRAALLCHRAESELVGLKCGVMDQMAVSLCREGHAMLLDCRTLAIEQVAIPGGLSIVILDTGTRRELSSSAYNERRASCDAAVAVARRRHPEVGSLRDVSLEELEQLRAEMDETTHRRARHVIEENARTLSLSRALRQGDRRAIGKLMAASHESLRSLYEVSSPALDRIVTLAIRHAACVGARMTGGGFGGSAVALVEESSVESFVQEVGERYRDETGEPGALYPCRAERGVALVDPD